MKSYEVNNTDAPSEAEPDIPAPQANDDHLEEFNIADPKLRCGVGPCRPSFMQIFADIRMFLASYSLAVMVSSALGFYMISQVTTMQKLFGMSSTQTGFLLSANDAGYMTVIIFASHFSRKGHKPLIIAVLGVAFGILAIISGIPHFIMDSYKGVFYFDPDTATTTVTSNATNVTTTSSVPACNRNASTTTSAITDEEIRNRVRAISFGILGASLVLQGAVKAPRIPLSLTFFDDHVPKTRVGLYIGINFAVIILGLAVATGLGSLFNRVYVTLQPTVLELKDPRFVGAWWLGFMVIGASAGIFALPLFCYPKYLKTNHKFRQEKKHVDEFKKIGNDTTQGDIEMNEVSANTTTDNTEEKVPKKEDVNNNENVAMGELKDFPKALWRLATNPVYAFIMLGNAIAVLGAMGRLVFFPKYLEVHYHMLPHQANLMYSVTILVGSAVGSIASGILMAVFKMTARGALLFATLLGIASNILILVGLALPCPQIQYQGFNLTRLVSSDSLGKHTGDIPYDFNDTCSMSCNCKDKYYLPICGNDGRTYFSPCHAGCAVIGAGATTFSECACMPVTSFQNATAGACEEKCSHLNGYLAIAFIGPFIGLLAVTPKMVVKMRCVAEQDRSLAVGIDSFISNVFGSFIGPIVFGAIIDTTCALTISGSCRIYDVPDFRYKFHVGVGGLGLASDLTHIFAILVVVFNKRFRNMFAE